MKNIFYLLIAASLIAGCSHKETSIDLDNPLIGTWNYVRVDSSAVIFSREGRFVQAPGYRFNSDGTMTERALAGFCATPPVSYSDYAGTWKILKEGVINIDRTNYDGQRTETIIFLFTCADTIKIFPIN